MFDMVSTGPVWMNAPSPTLVHVYRSGKGLEEFTWHVIDSVSPIVLASSCIGWIVGASIKGEYDLKCF